MQPQFKATTAKPARGVSDRPSACDVLCAIDGQGGSVDEPGVLDKKHDRPANLFGFPEATGGNRRHNFGQRGFGQRVPAANKVLLLTNTVNAAVTRYGHFGEITNEDVAALKAGEALPPCVFS